MALQKVLDEARQDRDQILGELEQGPPTSGEQTLLRQYSELARTRPLPGQAPRRRFSPRLLVPLAAVVLLAVLLLRLRESTPEVDPFLGPEASRVVLVAPADLTEPAPLFRWTCDHPEAATFRIVLYDETGDTAEPVAESLRSSLTQFQPDGPLPARILWRIQAFDASGRPVGQSEGILARP